MLSNMAAELGAEAGIIGVDEVTIAALEASGGDAEGAEQWVADDDAQYCHTVTLDASTLGPQVAAPHAPENTDDVGLFSEVAVNQCYIGACVGAKLQDLQMAASILRGRKISPNTRLLVPPRHGAHHRAGRCRWHACDTHGSWRDPVAYRLRGMCRNGRGHCCRGRSLPFHH